MTPQSPSVPYAEVIGDPIEQSKSPVIHNFWLEKLGIDGAYRRTRVGRSELHAYLEDRRKDADWRGCNVTMPLKLDALMLANSSSDDAVQAGAANLLLPREEGLFADNTDVDGAAAVIRRLARQGNTRSITLLGTGGAARGILVALKSMGMDRIAIHARNRDERINLANAFGLSLAPQPFEAPVVSDGLINATPLGMTGHAPLSIELDRMPATGWVFDLVSSPSPTPLIIEAQRRGLATSGGLAMLVEQAAAAFPLLFGAEPPRDTASDAELFRRLGQ